MNAEQNADVIGRLLHAVETGNQPELNIEFDILQPFKSGNRELKKEMIIMWMTFTFENIQLKIPVISDQVGVFHAAMVKAGDNVEAQNVPMTTLYNMALTKLHATHAVAKKLDSQYTAVIEAYDKIASPADAPEFLLVAKKPSETIEENREYTWAVTP